MSFKAWIIASLLLLTSNAWASSYLSNNTIECCSLWQSTMTVTKADGSPYPNCRVVMTILESVGVIQTQIGKYSYFTDSKGKALLAFTPQKPGEKVTITVDCGDNRAEYTAVVTGTAKGPELPKIDFTLPSIEQWQITSVAFIVVAVVILWKGKPFFDSLRKAAPKKKQ